MRIIIDSTTRVIDLITPSGTVPARVWEGHTESGIPVHAFITRVSVLATDNTAQFEAELAATRVPSADTEAFPARMVL